MSSLDWKVCWCVNKASIVVSLSDHVRRGRPRLCQGAEEQVQDQTLLCQTPTHGLPACPDDPGGRQHGNVRRAHTNRRNWAVPKLVLTCVWNRFPGLLWILCLYVPHSAWSVASAAFDAGVCDRVLSLKRMMVLYLHLCVETKCMHTTRMWMSHSSI